MNLNLDIYIVVICIGIFIVIEKKDIKIGKKILKRNIRNIIDKILVFVM